MVLRTGKNPTILQQKECQNMMRSVEKTAGLDVASSKLSAITGISKALFMSSMKTGTTRDIVCFVCTTSKTPTTENLCGQLKFSSKLLIVQIVFIVFHFRKRVSCIKCRWLVPENEKLDVEARNRYDADVTNTPSQWKQQVQSTNAGSAGGSDHDESNDVQPSVGKQNKHSDSRHAHKGNNVSSKGKNNDGGKGVSVMKALVVTAVCLIFMGSAAASSAGRSNVTDRECNDDIMRDRMCWQFGTACMKGDPTKRSRRLEGITVASGARVSMCDTSRARARDEISHNRSYEYDPGDNRTGGWLGLVDDGG